MSPNDEDYTPENCRWVTAAVSARNRRCVSFYTAFGESKTIGEWVEDFRCSIKKDALRRRIKTGWSVEDAITTGPLTLGSTGRKKKVIAKSPSMVHPKAKKIVGGAKAETWVDLCLEPYAAESASKLLKFLLALTERFPLKSSQADQL